MLREKAIRWTLVIVMAILGFGLAIAAFASNLGYHVPIWIWRGIVPTMNVSMLAPVDPDWSVALYFWGMPNAVLYGLIGLVVSQEWINRFHVELSKK